MKRTHAGALALVLGTLGCGKEEMFELQLTDTQHLIERIAVARLTGIDRELTSPIVVGDLDGDGIDDALIISMTTIDHPGQLGLGGLRTEAHIIYGGKVTGSIDVSTL